MRIVMTTDVVGGVWTYTIDLAAALTKAGALVKVVTLGPRPDADQRADAARRGLHVIESDHALEWLAETTAEVEAAGAAVATIAEDWRADIAHLNTPALAATARFTCPVVAMNHSCVATWRQAMNMGAPPREYAWRIALTGEGLRRADLVLVPTAAHGAAVATVHELTVLPRTVHNGRTAATLLEAVESDEVFATGRLWDRAKNIAALDGAAASLTWPVRVAGATRAPNGHRVAFQSIESIGHLPGAVVRRHLAGRPIFVAPARYEPFGLGVLEAAQAGCALVLNDIETFRELWHGAALFVDADDHEALGAAIRSLIEDRDQRHALGRAACERSARYSLEAMAQGTMRAYQRCLRTASDRHISVSA